MGTQVWVCRDPARREKFLALLRARPRSTVADLAERMALSCSTIRNLVAMFEREGKVVSELDSTARRIARSTAPKVVWLAPRRPARIGKPKIPRADGFRAGRYSPYGPTGTPADRAGVVQCFAVVGRG